MIIFSICMFILGVYAQKYFWPNLPESISKYKWLFLTLTITIMFPILKLPISFTSQTSLFYFLFIFSITMFIYDSIHNKKGKR